MAGNLADYEADRLGFLLRLRAEYGPVARLGARTTVISDPQLALEILRDRTDAFEVTENFLQQRVPRPRMADRLSARPLLNAALRPSVSNGVEAIVAERLTAGVAEFQSGSAMAFDPVPMLEKVYSQSVAQLWFGRGSEAIARQVGRLLDELAQVIGNPFALPAWTRWPVRCRIDARYRELLSTVRGELELRMSTPDKYRDLASAIVENNGGTHPVLRLADMIIGALLASHRVPAASGAWLLMLVADRPDLQTLFRAPNQNGGQPSDRGVALAHGAVMEALRLYPATWMIARTTSFELRLGRWQFKKGHNLLISPYVIHRDEGLFSNPLQFLPDRWTRPRLNQSALLSFGAGLHLCPGRSLAVTMLNATLAVLTDQYDVMRVAGPVAADPRTTLLPRGLQITLKARPAAGADLAWSSVPGSVTPTLATLTGASTAADSL